MSELKPTMHNPESESLKQNPEIEPSKQQNPETEAAKQVWDHISSTLTTYLENKELRNQAELKLNAVVENEVREYLDTILYKPKRGAKMYREISLIQVAYLIKFPGTNPLDRAPSARSQIGGALGKFLASNHIPGTENCFQNRSGGGGTKLDRGNEPAFDSLMTWMTSAKSEALEACFGYLCAEIASLARPVTPMPKLNLVALSHAAVMGLFCEMLSTSSEGNFEQYIVAALLDVYHRQYLTGLHVVTKKINATDKSSKTAGDIQAATSQKVIEAYEVTANSWTTKIEKALGTISSHGLERVHIVAQVDDYAKAATDLKGQTSEDISIVDLRGFCATMLALLEDTTYRALALNRLYRNLESYAQDPKWVNLYVDMLERRTLVAQ